MSVDHISKDTVAVVLAGGQGKRLGGLTRNRCKPALPFGARFRSIDFTLSNCVNSGLRHIAIATQYQSQTLIPHIRRNWGRDSSPACEPVEIWQAEERHQHGYSGTADAVYKNLDGIDRHAPRYVLVLAADHVYGMNYADLLEFHREAGADVTIACQPVPPEQARNFGILSVHGDEVSAFHEKPERVDSGSEPLASMGIYVFDAKLLRRLLCEDAHRPDSWHDFGRNVIPACVLSRGIRVCAHPFRDPCTGGPGYWRDIGTVDAYWNASMELLANKPPLDLYSPDWPIRPTAGQSAPSRLPAERRGRAALISRSIVADHSRIEGAVIHSSVVFSGVSIAPGSIVEDCILLPRARVGAHCRLRRVIVDEDLSVPHHYALDGSTGTTFDGCETSPGGVAVLWKAPMVRTAAERAREPLAGRVVRQRSAASAGSGDYQSVSN